MFYRKEKTGRIIQIQIQFPTKFLTLIGDQLGHTEEVDLLQLLDLLVPKARFILVLPVEVYGKQLTQVLHGKIFLMDILEDL